MRLLTASNAQFAGNNPMQRADQIMSSHVDEFAFSRSASNSGE